MKKLAFVVVSIFLMACGGNDEKVNQPAQTTVAPKDSIQEKLTLNPEKGKLPIKTFLYVEGTRNMHLGKYDTINVENFDVDTLTPGIQKFVKYKYPLNYGEHLIHLFTECTDSTRLMGKFQRHTNDDYLMIGEITEVKCD